MGGKTSVVLILLLLGAPTRPADDWPPKAVQEAAEPLVQFLAFGWDLKTIAQRHILFLRGLQPSDREQRLFEYLKKKDNDERDVCEQGRGLDEIFQQYKERDRVHYDQFDSSLVGAHHWVIGIVEAPLAYSRATGGIRTWLIANSGIIQADLVFLFSYTNEEDALRRIETLAPRLARLHVQIKQLQEKYEKISEVFREQMFGEIPNPYHRTINRAVMDGLEDRVSELEIEVRELQLHPGGKGGDVVGKIKQLRERIRILREGIAWIGGKGIRATDREGRSLQVTEEGARGLGMSYKRALSSGLYPQADRTAFLILALKEWSWMGMGPPGLKTDDFKHSVKAVTNSLEGILQNLLQGEAVLLAQVRGDDQSPLIEVDAIWADGKACDCFDAIGKIVPDLAAEIRARGAVPCHALDGRCPKIYEATESGHIPVCCLCTAKDVPKVGNPPDRGKSLEEQIRRGTWELEALLLVMSDLKVVSKIFFASAKFPDFIGIARQKIQPVTRLSKEVLANLWKLRWLSLTRLKLEEFLKGLNTGSEFTYDDLVRVFGKQEAEAVQNRLMEASKLNPKQSVEITRLGKHFKVHRAHNVKSLLNAQWAQAARGTGQILRSLVGKMGRLAGFGALFAGDLIASGSLDEARIQWEEQQIVKGYLRTVLWTLETVQGEASRYREYLEAIGEDPVSATCWAHMGLAPASAKLLDAALGLDLAAEDGFKAMDEDFMRRAVDPFKASRDPEIRARVEGTRRIDASGRLSVSIVLEARKEGGWAPLQSGDVEDPYAFVLAQYVERIGMFYRNLKKVVDDRQDKLEKFWGSPLGLDFWWVKFGLAWENLGRLKGDLSHLWDSITSSSEPMDFAKNIQEKYLGGP